MELAPHIWLLLGTAALLVGIAKTAIGGLATISVAIFAFVMPARESTAALLLLLLVGDVYAVMSYRRDCDWSLLRHLIPGVLPGVLLGTLVLGAVDDPTLRRGIGIVLLTLVVLQLALMRADLTAGTGWPWGVRAGTGIAAGFATMVANSAGAVMAIYLVGQGVEKRRFLGTAAWFFLGVNLSKVPFSAGLGLIDRSMVVQTLVLAPLVIVGGFLGVRLARRLAQTSFDVTVLVASAFSAFVLVLG